MNNLEKLLQLDQILKDNLSNISASTRNYLQTGAEGGFVSSWAAMQLEVCLKFIAMNEPTRAHLYEQLSKKGE